MLQAYSSNITFQANSPIPLTNLIIDKGCAERLTAPSTIELNRRGVYMIEVNGFGTGGEAGTDTIQLYKNGVALANAQTQFTVAAGNIVNFSYQTLIQVQENNCNCNCLSSPVVLQIYNGAQELTDGYLNVIVTKLC